VTIQQGEKKGKDIFVHHSGINQGTVTQNTQEELY
jgi:cold shock CspA family protein